MSIHASAIVHPNAVLGDGVEIGPNVVVEENVVIGDDCRIMANAYITGHTRIGRRNQIHVGAVIGHTPQDLTFDDRTVTGLEIGDDNIIREYTTIHRATRGDSATTIGNGCFLMAHAHIAHDCRVGDGVIICNNSSAAGHVELDDRVFVSGNVVIHQFSRVGTLCMLGGGCQVGQDVPPYTTIAGRSEIRGLNVVGLRRAGIAPAARAAIKAVYKDIFAGRGNIEGAIAACDAASDLPEIDAIREFYAADTRRQFAWPPGRENG